MPLVKHNNVVEALSANRADEPLDVSILPGASASGFDFFDAKADDTFLKRFAIDRVVISKQISRRVVIRKCLNDLLSRPFCGRMLGDIELEHTPTIVRKHHKHVEQTKRCRRHNEKVASDNLFRMILQKSFPSGRRRFVVSLAGHVLGYSRFSQVMPQES